MPKKYVLIEIHEFNDPEMETAEDMAGYLISELNNHPVIDGNVSAHEDLDSLVACVA